MRSVSALALVLILGAASATEAATLYVNNSGTPACSDATTKASNSASSPWCSIGRAAWGSTNRAAPVSAQAAAAGDLVLVTAGTYSTAGTGNRFEVAYNPVNSGTAGNKITFRASGTVTLTLSSSLGPVIGAGTGASGADYIVWDGFTLNEANITPQADTGPVVFFGSNGSEALNLTITGVIASYDDNHNGIRVEQSDGVLVRNNTITGFGSNGGYGQNDAAIMLYDSNDTIIEHNVLTNSGAGIYIKGQHPGFTQRRTIVRFNWISGMYFAGLIIGPASYDSTIAQNVIEDCQTTSARIGIRWYSIGTNEGEQTQLTRLYNNTVYNCYPMYVTGAIGASNVIRNNIFDANGLSQNWQFQPVTAAGFSAIDRNLYNGGSSGNVARTDVDGSGTNYTFASWQSTFSYDANGASASPSFVTPGSNYHLQGGSAALTLGVDTYDLDGDSNTTEVIPAGAYVTGSESIGLAADTPAVPTSRLATANWQTAGVTPNGGIPARSTICATIAAATYGNGATDATSGIQAAINACPTGQTVLLGAGTFRVDSTLSLTTAITLRGAGAGVTILEKTNGAYKPAGSWPQSQPTPASEAPIVRVGNAAFSHFLTSGAKTLTADAAKGASTVTLNNVTGLSVGQYVEVSEDQFFTGNWRALGTVQSGAANRWEVWSSDRLAFARYRLVTLPSGTITSSNAGTDRLTLNTTTGLQVGDLLYITGHSGTFSPTDSAGLYLVASIPTAGQVTLTGYSSGTAIDVTSGGTGGSFQTGKAYSTFTAGPVGATGSPLEWFNRGGGHLYSEVKRITAIVGNDVTFESPLTDSYRTAYSAEVAVNDTAFVENVGVEDLTLFRGSRGALEFSAAAKSWAKNVEIVEWLGHGIQISQSYRIEVTGSYLHHAAWPVPGGGGYALALEDGSSEILFTNSISVDANKNMVANSGGAGSVVSYNYFDDSFIWYDLNWQEVGANASHFAGPHHVLFEGNRATNGDSDFTHGSAYSHTFARNHFTGQRASYTDNTNARAIGLGVAQLNMSFVGNVLGTSGAMGGWVLTDPGDFWTSKFIYKIGYEPGDPWQSGDPPTVASLIDGDNFNYLNSNIRTAASASVPSSYYLGSAPSFFGTCAWPWVDATGGTKLATLPAYARYQAGQPNDTTTDRCSGAPPPSGRKARIRMRVRGDQ